jgi:hypothetical protein
MGEENIEKFEDRSIPSIPFWMLKIFYGKLKKFSLSPHKSWKFHQTFFKYAGGIKTELKN